MVWIGVLATCEHNIFWLFVLSVVWQGKIICDLVDWWLLLAKDLSKEKKGFCLYCALSFEC